MTAIASQGHGRRGPGIDRIDEISVERAVAGDPPTWLSAGEIRAAVAVLTRLGYGTFEIARRVGVSDRTVGRHRAQLRTESAA